MRGNKSSCRSIKKGLLYLGSVVILMLYPELYLYLFDFTSYN